MENLDELKMRWMHLVRTHHATISLEVPVALQALMTVIASIALFTIRLLIATVAFIFGTLILRTLILGTVMLAEVSIVPKKSTID